MARDLIPPPAPSWRGLQPDGTPNLVELPPERPAPAEAPPPPPPRHLPPSQHRNRFGFLGGALGGVILAAVAVFAIVVTTKDPSSDEGLFKNWSKWQPEEKSMTAGPAEIATHVAPEYKQDDGTQLVTVTGGPLQVQGIPPDDVLVQAQDSIHQLSGHAVMYTLSGLGKRGSILAGKPSNERHRLPPRGARGRARRSAGARVVLVPLSAERRHGRRAAAAAQAGGRRGPGPGGGEESAAGDPLSAGRSQEPAVGPARRHGAGQGAAGKADPEARGGDDRLADAVEPVPGRLHPDGGPTRPLRAAAPEDRLIAAGLCDGCAHRRSISNTRGSTFIMCERGLRGEPGYAKYPRLPVLACPGYQPAKCGDDPGGPGPRDGASPAS